MKQFSFYVSALLLPLSTAVIMWVSRSLSFFRQGNMGLWACAFSIVWFFYWSFIPQFSKTSILLCLIYIFLFFYIRINVFLPAAVFVYYVCVSGIIIASSHYIVGVFLCAILLFLGYENFSERRKFFDYRVVSLIFLMFFNFLNSYIVTFLSIVSYGFFSYFLFRPKSLNIRDEMWSQWLFISIYLVLQQEVSYQNITMLSVQVLGTISITCALLWDKKYTLNPGVILCIFSIPWMNYISSNIAWIVLYVGLAQWTYYFLYYRQENMLPGYITGNMAAFLSGMLIWMYSIGFLSGVYCIWRTSLYYAGIFCFMYGISCITYIQSIYSALRSRKFGKRTAVEVHILWIGILVWNIFSGWYLCQKHGV